MKIACVYLIKEKIRALIEKEDLTKGLKKEY
jgi:hypothetical protein